MVTSMRKYRDAHCMARQQYRTTYAHLFPRRNQLTLSCSEVRWQSYLAVAHAKQGMTACTVQRATTSNDLRSIDHCCVRDNDVMSGQDTCNAVPAVEKLI